MDLWRARRHQSAWRRHQRTKTTTATAAAAPAAAQAEQQPAQTDDADTPASERPIRARFRNASVGSMHYTLNHVRLATNIGEGYFAKKAAGEFIVIDITVNNIGSFNF